MPNASCLHVSSRLTAIFHRAKPVSRMKHSGIRLSMMEWWETHLPRNQRSAIAPPKKQNNKIQNIIKETEAVKL